MTALIVQALLWLAGGACVAWYVGRFLRAVERLADAAEYAAEFDARRRLLLPCTCGPPHFRARNCPAHSAGTADTEGA